ncbi:MAG: VOC family protein [Acidobacteriota bacterium]|nr:VOC family protein [Acidobacteriota bacterium]MDQ5872506.1 VOC family protein [Acidobacteriota bacterium]
MSKAKPIPEGYHSVTPYLCCKDAAAAIEFYKKAFGATEVMRMGEPSGKVGHAELQIGDSRIMLADEFPEMGFLSPPTVGGSSVMVHLYVEDVDTTANRAVAAGAKVTRPIADQFYGDRGGQLEDPFGHKWYVATHTEDLSAEEIGKRAAAMTPSS